MSGLRQTLRTILVWVSWSLSISAKCECSPFLRRSCPCHLQAPSVNFNFDRFEALPRRVSRARVRDALRIHEDVGHSAASYVYNPVYTPMCAFASDVNRPACERDWLRVPGPVKLMSVLAQFSFPGQGECLAFSKRAPQGPLLWSLFGHKLVGGRGVRGAT